MEIQSRSGSSHYPNIQLRNGHHQKPQMYTVKDTNFVRYDSLELSSVTPTRELPEDAIHHVTPHFFFNSEINASLDKVVENKSEEIKRTVYQIIEFNIFPTNMDYSDEERAALLEMGLSQADYLAEHYMSKGESSEFMKTMNLLAALSKTREVDPKTGTARYAELPQRPVGAPSDYISTKDLMKRFDPELYGKLQAELEGGGTNFASILIQFTQKAKAHPEWREQFLSEQNSRMTALENTTITNRFKGTSTANIHELVTEMKEIMEKSQFTNNDFLFNNLVNFYNSIEKIHNGL
ncbi:hypothetical protein J27TS8_39430 [Robertmurraya siralis]|uniref:Uncharacterized protein n=1 Tax=Robertmurraya siralis TaxID=77777 RepID=A0A920BV42_9BACI|nr:hypothetical protein [Robertmurraya siralis]GIN63950.1 hypothetical protein J27TS8_39430 [Robertmurraya siralis]